MVSNIGNSTHRSRIAALALALILPSILAAGFLTQTAHAACNAIHQNAGGWEGSTYRGNRGGIFINDGLNYSNLNSSIHRSLFVYGSGPNDVEIGWTANNGSHTYPVPYTEWVDRGADSGVNFKSKSLTIGDTYNFQAEDDDGNQRFNFFIDSDDQGFSDAMNFSKGILLTNSERRNDCDTWYAHFQNLRECRGVNPCTWHDYVDLSCEEMPSGYGYHFDKVDPNEHYIRQSGGTNC